MDVHTRVLQNGAKMKTFAPLNDCAMERNINFIDRYCTCSLTQTMHVLSAPLRFILGARGAIRPGSQHPGQSDCLRGCCEGKELDKQDVWIADSTGSLKIVAWENAVGQLEVGIFYCFTAVMVKLYHEQFLSLRHNSHLPQIDDIHVGVVSEDPLVMLVKGTALSRRV